MGIIIDNNSIVSQQSGGIDSVISFQVPTYANNYTWYRLYSSGWVEQGGISSTNSGSQFATITLPIEMANTNYTVTVSEKSPSDIYPYCSFQGYYIVSTTQVKVGNRSWGGEDAVTSSWEVKGMSNGNINPNPGIIVEKVNLYCYKLNDESYVNSYSLFVYVKSLPISIGMEVFDINGIKEGQIYRISGSTMKTDDSSMAPSYSRYTSGDLEI